MSVINEIVDAAPDQELVFDASIDIDRYMKLRWWLWVLNCDVLVMIPRRIVVSKKRWLFEKEDVPEYRTELGQAFGRIFYHEARQPTGAAQ